MIFYIKNGITGAPIVNLGNSNTELVVKTIGDLLLKMKEPREIILYDNYANGVFTFNDGIITDVGIIYEIKSGGGTIYSELEKIDVNNYKVKNDAENIKGMPTITLPSADFSTWNYVEDDNFYRISILDSYIEQEKNTGSVYFGKNGNRKKHQMFTKGFLTNNGYSIFFNESIFFVLLNQKEFRGNTLDFGIIAKETISYFTDLINQANSNVYGYCLKNDGGEIYRQTSSQISNNDGDFCLLPTIFSGVPIDFLCSAYGNIKYTAIKNGVFTVYITDEFILRAYQSYGRINWIRQYV